MLGLLKKKKPYEDEARAVYGAALAHIRKPVFYERYGVPDSFDGRFDLLLVHLFMIMEAGGEAEFNQALFDASFADMDQSLREMGIGDMGVPKHMRKMMKAFNGRMHAYRDALADGDLEGALRRNVYGTVAKPDTKGVKALTQYCEKTLKTLRKGGFERILTAKNLFEV